MRNAAKRWPNCVKAMSARDSSAATLLASWPYVDRPDANASRMFRSRRSLKTLADVIQVGQMSGVIGSPQHRCTGSTRRRRVGQFSAGGGKLSLNLLFVAEYFAEHFIHGYWF
jgi:hypothetical protein